ncbi:restriction endonuclease subunit S [Streptococcus suis]
MTKEKSTVPRLRFPGFTDAWKQRKLGEVVYRSNITSSNKTLPRLEFEDINSGTGTLNKDIRQKIYDSRKGLEFKEEDILFGKLRPYLKKWWFAEYKGIAVGDFWNLKSDIWDNRFLFTYVQSNSFQVVANDTSGTKMPRSDWKLVSNSIAIFPALPEQEVIGSFFSDLDQLITLHQRKLDDVKELKKALLQKMFPKGNGNDFPELRFPEFTDAWKQRKLGEVGTVAMCRRIFKEQTSEIGEIPFYKIGTFGETPDAYITRELFEEYKKKYSYPNKGDILISASGSIGRTVEYSGQDEYFQDSNIVWLQPRKNLDNSFLKQFYSIVKWSGIEGSTIKRLYNGNILNTEIILPTLPEQEAIGSFFSDLDQLITLHQRQLNHLKLLKKALLQQMFI